MNSLQTEIAHNETLASQCRTVSENCTSAFAYNHEPLPVTLITATSGWQVLNARELWKYRELLGFFIWRDVKVRYKQTVLGAAWAILQPAMMMVVFSIFFGRMANVNTSGIPYPLFVFTGLLPWMFFS